MPMHLRASCPVVVGLPLLAALVLPVASEKVWKS
jgi:hypothetical protein